MNCSVFDNFLILYCDVTYWLAKSCLRLCCCYLREWGETEGGCRLVRSVVLLCVHKRSVTFFQ